MANLKVITGRYTSATARLNRLGVRFKGKTYKPLAIRGFYGTEGAQASVVGGAFAGGLLAGAPGAVIGSVAGGKNGKTYFQLLLEGGPTLTCECKSNDYPGLAVTIQAMIDGQPLPFQWGNLIWVGAMLAIMVGVTALQLAFSPAPNVPESTELGSEEASVAPIPRAQSALVGAGGTLSCGGQIQSGELVISERQATCRWPFKVANVKIACRGSAASASVVVVAGGQSYALNGRAQRKYAPLDPIWREDEQLAAQGMAGIKVDVGPYIASGLALCH